MTHIQAHAYTKGRGGKSIKWAVIHDMEAPERTTTAESVAKWFARADAKTSAHECIDTDSWVTCVYEQDTAWAAPGANQQGYHFELAGYARQTEAEWLDSNSKRVLEITAKRVARLCIKHRIPVRRLTPAQIRAGEKGIIGHYDVTVALNGGKGHTDPGKSFPWNYFLGRVNAYVKAAVAAASAPATPAWPLPVGHGFGRPNPSPKIHSGYYSATDKAALAKWQTQMAKRGWRINKDGLFTEQTETVLRSFQREKRLIDTNGVLGPQAWRAAWTAPTT